MRLCLFSSYFAGESLPFFVRYYLRTLRLHFDRIVFLTNDNRPLDDESAAWLAAHVDEILPVRNEGFDFGMWQKAIRHLGGLGGCRRVALVNDSCICFAPLDDFFRWADATDAPAMGMVRSNEIAPHLQSYFMLFSGAALPVVEKHVLGVDVVTAAYDDVVLRGELGLSAALRAAGIPLLARYSPEPDFDLNASFEYCDRFIDDGMPLIKRKMLQYPQGHLVKFAMQNGIGVHPTYYIRKIRARFPARVDELDRLLAGQFVPSRSRALQLARRVIRYWFIIRLERLGALFLTRNTG